MKLYIYVIALEECFEINGMIDDETKVMDHWLENLFHCFKRDIDFL